MQHCYFPHWQGKNNCVCDDVGYSVGIPERIAVDATSILDRLVPEASYRRTLKNSGYRRPDGPTDHHGETGITKPPEIFGDKYSKVETDHRYLVEAKNDLIKDLSIIEPLRVI